VYRPREHPEGQPLRAYENLQTRSAGLHQTHPSFLASRASYMAKPTGADRTSLFGGRTLLLLAVPGLDTSGNHAAKPNLIRPPRPPRVASEFRRSLSKVASELLFNPRSTDRRDAPLASNFLARGAHFFMFSFFYVFIHAHIREIKISGARGLYTAHLF
jgi:hypothetical protein